jgi:hypothetical protein
MARKPRRAIAGRNTTAGVAGCARVRRSSVGDGKIGGDAWRSVATDGVSTELAVIVS